MNSSVISRVNHSQFNRILIAMALLAPFSISDAYTTPRTITASTNIISLLLPNGKMIPVKIPGTIIDSRAGIDAASASFSVYETDGMVTPPRPSVTTRSAASIVPPERVPLLNEATSADVVRIPVAVREPGNRVVMGLDKENFRLFEDGVEQSIAQLRSRPCTALGLLISTSDSTDPKRAQMQAGFQEFARIASPVREFSVAQAPTIADSSAAIDKWMGSLGQAPDSRRVILVITDAVSGDLADDSGARLADEQRRIAAFVQQDVLLYAVNVADNNEAPTRFLAASTKQTGGRRFAIGADNVVAAAGGIGAEVRNLYELEYTSKNTAHGGAYRTVQVEVIAGLGLPPLKLNYRPGYFATLS